MTHGPGCASNWRRPHRISNRYLDVVRKLWGDLPADDLRPSDVEALMNKIGATKSGRANKVLYALRSMCSWARGPIGKLHADPTHKVMPFETGEGHAPWKIEQEAYAEANLTGMLRRAYVLGRYTGQRASDIVRLGPTDGDGNTILPRQKKTGVRPVCPIFPELEAEMATWEKRPGPFLLQDSGKNAGQPVTTNQFAEGL